MNFYKHHLGDYAAATAHLSWDEDCAYRRLIDVYYKREAPIDADLKLACRLVRASTPSQKRAVESVLQEFFTLESDGWHQKRCDEEIEAASQQAATNRRIAEERELRKRGRSVNEPLNESSTNRSPAPADGVNLSRLQTPDSTSQSKNQEQDSAQINPRADGATEKRTKAAQGTRLPEPFMLTADMRTWAAEEVPNVDLRKATAEFVDYWRAVPGSKGKKLDWVGTWRNRMREVDGRRTKLNGHKPAGTTHAQVMAALDAATDPNSADFP